MDEGGLPPPHDARAGGARLPLPPSGVPGDVGGGGGGRPRRAAADAANVKIKEGSKVVAFDSEDEAELAAKAKAKARGKRTGSDSESDEASDAGRPVHGSAAREDDDEDDEEEADRAALASLLVEDEEGLARGEGRGGGGPSRARGGGGRAPRASSASGKGSRARPPPPVVQEGGALARPPNPSASNWCAPCQRNIGSDKRDLTIHQLAFHPPEGADTRPHKCPWDGCTASFSQPGQRNDHVEADHKFRRRPCPIGGCVRALGGAEETAHKDMSTLRNHFINHHTDECANKEDKAKKWRETPVEAVYFPELAKD